MQRVDKALANGANPFELCNLISLKSIELLKSLDYAISDSEAISCVVSGTVPDNLEERRKQHKMLSTLKTPYMSGLLSYVDDDEVKSCVELSYEESVRIGSLVFRYDSLSDDAKKSRVRILTRMIWYNR